MSTSTRGSFFLQAEDGIRDIGVTGVQTCALPICLACPRSELAHSIEEALQVQAGIGFPVVIRPSFTLGGSGGGIAYNRSEERRVGTELRPAWESDRENEVCRMRASCDVEYIDREE